MMSPATLVAVGEARTHHRTLNRHGVQSPVDMRQGIALGNERRVDTQVEDSGCHVRRDGERANYETEVASVLDVARVDLIDALGGDLARKHVCAKRKTGNERELVPRIAAGDVERRIGLGETGLLGRLQGVFERSPAIRHARQNVVARSVDDAADGAKSVGRQ